MLHGYVLCENSGKRVLVDRTIVIGRTQDCDLRIDDSAASRRHVEIMRRDDGYVWKDLGSTNGTVLNGSRMLAGSLKDGDVITIGETTFRFQVEQIEEVDRKGTIPVSSARTILSPEGPPKAVSLPDKERRLLETVYAVVNEIATNYDPCSLMDRILQTAMPAINAQRGAIFLAQDDGSLGPCPQCGHVHRIRDGELRAVEPGKIHISNTVARPPCWMMGKVCSTATLEAKKSSAPPRAFCRSSFNPLSAYPLRAKHGIIGILYIDSDRTDQAYSEEDLLLAASVGNSAGIALENAQMHQEILVKQRIEQEIATAWTIQEGFLVKEWPEGEKRFEVYGETRARENGRGGLLRFRPACEEHGRYSHWRTSAERACPRRSPWPNSWRNSGFLRGTSIRRPPCCRS